MPSPVFSAENPQASEPGNAPPVTFGDFLPQVLKHYPALAKQTEVAGLARALSQGAHSALLPKVTGSSSVMTTDDPVQVFGSLLRQEAFSQDNFALPALNSPRHRTNFNFTMAGEVPIFNAFETISTIRASKHRLRSEEMRRQFTEMEAGLVALEAYLKLILSARLVADAAEAEKAAGEDLRQADELKQKGMIVGADFYAARVTAAAIRQRRHAYEAAYRTAQAAANILRGAEPSAGISAAGDLPAEARPARQLSEWRSRAFADRKDVAAEEAMIKALEADVFKEKASLLPRVNAFGAVTEDTRDWQTGGENFIMGFKGTMDIVEPGFLPRKRAAERRLAVLQADLAELKDRISQSLSEQSHAYEAALADLPVTDAAAEDASQAAELTGNLYREGRKSIADLLEMRMASLAARERQKELRARLELGYASLAFLSGGLDEAALREAAARLGGATA